MAFKDYDDPELLRRVQRVRLIALAEYDRVCRKLGIEYAVYGGTAIGAVRHEGFIPWDDDADVCMTRADYERFLVEAPAELGDEFSLENSRTHEDFPFMMSYLALKNTLFIPEAGKLSTYRMPLGLDIFPLDNMADDQKGFKRQSRLTWFWGRMLFLQGTPRPYLEIEGPLKYAILAVTGAVFWAMRLLRVKPRSLMKKWEDAARSYEDVSTAQMTDFTMRDPENWAVSKDELFPTIDVPFEGLMVKLPREYDKLLRRGYGDYMELPPIEKRKNHQPFLIELKDYGIEETP